ncbi:MAG: PIN domain-containing protein [Bauldia sp.]|nr:PIN domain-containing protein [Bauldia sp.]
MIYLDSSVVLAHVLAENRRPDEALWREPLTSSLLLSYEVWNRLNAKKLAAVHGEDADAIFAATVLIDLTPTILRRALSPFPAPVRTLDGLHLATMVFLQRENVYVELATYDVRMATAAAALGIGIAAI